MATSRPKPPRMADKIKPTPNPNAQGRQTAQQRQQAQQQNMDKAMERGYNAATGKKPKK